MEGAPDCALGVTITIAVRGVATFSADDRIVSVNDADCPCSAAGILSCLDLPIEDNQTLPNAKP